MESSRTSWPLRWHVFFTPWLIALGMCVLAVLARTYLIQPPDIAHGCDKDLTWWCALRLGIIYTYAFHTVGQVALALVLATLVLGRIWLAGAALAVGFCALVLYCYEPGAVAVVSGAVLLARLQHAHSARAGAPVPKNRQAK